jgi:hypothetical protein
MQAASRVLAAVPQQPLLTVFAAGGKPTQLLDTAALLAGPANDRALTNLVVIGLADDPLVKACSQQEARFDKDGVVYVFGFGYFQGDVGIIESERNPFLYSSTTTKAPYVAHVLVLTGTTPAGVGLAVEAFLRDGIVNGVVVNAGFTRPKRSLIEAPPWTPKWRLPAGIVAPGGSWKQVGVSLIGGTELSGVLEESGELPASGVRVKYWRPGTWSGAGNKMAIRDFQTGLHRRGAGNGVAIFEFPSPAQAAKAGPAIAGAAKLDPKGTGRWTREGEVAPLGGGLWRQELTLSGGNLLFSSFQK